MGSPEIPYIAAVYEITLGCGKRYIGSSKIVGRRITYHRSLLRRGVHYSKEMQRDFNAGGSFSWRIFPCDETMLLVNEQKKLSYWFSRRSVYNISPTAGSPRGVKHSEESNALRRAAIERWHSNPENRAKRRAWALRQHQDGNLGPATWKKGK